MAEVIVKSGPRQWTLKPSEVDTLIDALAYGEDAWDFPYNMEARKLRLRLK